VFRSTTLVGTEDKSMFVATSPVLAFLVVDMGEGVDRSLWILLVLVVGAPFLASTGFPSSTRSWAQSAAFVKCQILSTAQHMAGVNKCYSNKQALMSNLSAPAGAKVLIPSRCGCSCP